MSRSEVRPLSTPESNSPYSSLGLPRVCGKSIIAMPNFGSSLPAARASYHTKSESPVKRYVFWNEKVSMNGANFIRNSILSAGVGR